MNQGGGHPLPDPGPAGSGGQGPGKGQAILLIAIALQESPGVVCGQGVPGVFVEQVVFETLQRATQLLVFQEPLSKPGGVGAGGPSQQVRPKRYVSQPRISRRGMTIRRITFRGPGESLLAGSKVEGL